MLNIANLLSFTLINKSNYLNFFRVLRTRVFFFHYSLEEENYLIHELVYQNDNLNIITNFLKTWQKRDSNLIIFAISLI
jgi:hypothetical protein